MSDYEKIKRARQVTAMQVLRALLERADGPIPQSCVEAITYLMGGMWPSSYQMVELFRLVPEALPWGDDVRQAAEAHSSDLDGLVSDEYSRMERETP